MTENEFDIKVRSLLENASEPVPEGVWEGVSQALDNAAGKKRRIIPALWWRVAGITAVAAAVTLGVFLWPQKQGSFAVVEEQEKAPVSAVDPVVIPDEPAASPVGDAGNPIVAAVPRAVPAASPAPAGTSSDKEETVQNLPDSTLPQVAEEVNSANSAEPHTDPLPETADPESGSTVRFPEWNEVLPPAKSRGRVAMTLGGSAFATGRPSAAQAAPVRKFSAPQRAPGATGITPVNKQSTYGMPFTVGLGVRYTFADRFSVGTGVQYSLLSRTFVGTYNEVSTSVENNVGHSAIVRSVTTDIDNYQHYIGIPVTFSYDFVQTKRIRAYVQAGGTVEKNVKNHYRFSSTTEKISYTEKVKGVQWSVGAGLGVEVMLSPHLGFYVDPGVRYYFKGNQPASLRTAQPVMVDLNAGFRFNI